MHRFVTRNQGCLLLYTCRNVWQAVSSGRKEGYPKRCSTSTWEDSQTWHRPGQPNEQRSRIGLCEDIRNGYEALWTLWGASIREQHHSSNQGHLKTRAHQAAVNIWQGGTRCHMGSYSYRHLKKTYGYLETLSERAKLREGWESESGFQTSKVRYFRTRAPGCLLPPWGTERSLVPALRALTKASEQPDSSCRTLAGDLLGGADTRSGLEAALGMAFLVQAVLDLARLSSRGGSWTNKT